MPRGLEVSQTDLKDTATQDKTFSSKQLSPKSRIEGDGEVITDGTGIATTLVRHELPYPPAHLFFFNPGNRNASIGAAPDWVKAERSTTWGLMDNFSLTVTANAVTCTVRIEGKANTKYRFHYFIFVEPAK